MVSSFFFLELYPMNVCAVIVCDLIIILEDESHRDIAMYQYQTHVDHHATSTIHFWRCGDDAASIRANQEWLDYWLNYSPLISSVIVYSLRTTHDSNGYTFYPPDGTHGVSLTSLIRYLTPLASRVHDALTAAATSPGGVQPSPDNQLHLYVPVDTYEPEQSASPLHIHLQRMLWTNTDFAHRDELVWWRLRVIDTPPPQYYHLRSFNNYGAGWRLLTVTFHRHHLVNGLLMLSFHDWYVTLPHFVVLFFLYFISLPQPNFNRVIHLIVIPSTVVAFLPYGMTLTLPHTI
jgi:hypothetical protein